jgi:hypothetical protein
MQQIRIGRFIQMRSISMSNTRPQGRSPIPGIDASLGLECDVRRLLQIVWDERKIVMPSSALK